MLGKNILMIFLFLFTVTDSIASSGGGDSEKKVVADRSKQIISKLKVGGFSHIGGVKALSIIMAEIDEAAPNMRSENALEIGCGFGGSANFIQNSGYSNIWAIDKKSDAIDYAMAKYPDIKFKAADILDITDEFSEEFFSLAYIINTASGISDQNNLWQEVKSICKEGAILAIMDYSMPTRSDSTVLLKPDAKIRYPIPLEDTKRIMNYIGWEIISEKDITHDFKQWHLDAIAEIVARSELLMSAGFSEDEINYVVDYYRNIVELLDEKKIGGTILIARKR